MKAIQKSKMDFYSETTIMCKSFWKRHSFCYFTSISELFYPLPHINFENYILYVGKVYAVRKINIAIGGGENHNRRACN